MALPDFSKLTARFGWQFKEPGLLQQAFTHRSFINENPQIASAHNERLEFLGDAVLELVVTNFLYRHYPQATEGDLTAYRSALVNTDSLSRAATELNLNDYLLLSKGEAKDTGRARSAILADTFESLLGALFLDQGYVAADQFITAHLLAQTDDLVASQDWQDAKSLFQEKAQAKMSITPHYEVTSEEGPDHDKIFTVGLYLGEELAASGSGPSKQRAEQEAAKSALAKYNW
ncbi:MAG: ribonuclease III [Patescibacteria group bacterium]|nr:ribonuclease III [Patescibacteria group bacterium]